MISARATRSVRADAWRSPRRQAPSPAVVPARLGTGVGSAARGPTPESLADPSLMARFLARFEVAASGCWLWTGGITGRGYGQLSIRTGRRIRAHRAAFEHYVGPIPDGLQLDHLCRVRACVCPEHLEAVTSAENTLRGHGPTARNAAKTHCAAGHEFTPQNTRYRPSGWRACRECEYNRRAARRPAPENAGAS